MCYAKRRELKFNIQYIYVSFVSGSQNHILSKIRGVNLYVRSFRNFPIAFLKRMFHLYPILVKLRKQNLAIKVENSNQFYMAGYFGGFEPYTGDSMSINFLKTEKAFIVTGKSGRTVTIRHVFDDGDFPGVFYTEEYIDINVEGKTVIDVGCSIGDSPLYFYLFGARKIYAYEPTKYAFNYAMENVVINKLEDVIIVKNSAVGIKNSKILIDNSRRITGGSALKYDPHGSEVEIVSFMDIVKQVNEKDLVLKMDCEGCEYDIFSSIQPIDMVNFSQVVLEYHDGPELLMEFLSKAGFRTELKGKEDKLGIIVAIKTLHNKKNENTA